MTKYFLAAAFVLITSLAVYGRTAVPAPVPVDGYDHSFEIAHHVAGGDSGDEPGY
jgi:hypothetical protein